MQQEGQCSKTGWARGAVGNNFRDSHWLAYGVLNIRLGFYPVRDGKPLECCQSNFFKASLDCHFLKMLQSSISFGLKFKCFISVHKVLHSQTSACLFSIICLLPTCTLHFSQIGLHAVPWIGHDDSCLCVFLHAICPVRRPTLSVHRVIGSVLEGPLCARRAPLCLVLSSFPSIATLYLSHVVWECTVFF